MRDLLTTAGRVARKEFRGFFATPAAYLFLGAFLAVTLFVFFWVETFFARNIADVRPLFQWLPLLLIFLVAALTMRAWSEERRGGTLESLLTAPVAPLALVPPWCWCSCPCFWWPVSSKLLAIRCRRSRSATVMVGRCARSPCRV